MSKVSEKLEALRALFEDPAHWTKGAFALRADGAKVGHNYKGAVCWCLVGGLNKVAPKFEEKGELRTRLRDALPLDPDLKEQVGSLLRFNDAPSTTHADILSLIDRAIEAEAHA